MHRLFSIATIFAPHVYIFLNFCKFKLLGRRKKNYFHNMGKFVLLQSILRYERLNNWDLSKDDYFVISPKQVNDNSIFQESLECLVWKNIRENYWMVDVLKELVATLSDLFLRSLWEKNSGDLIVRVWRGTGNDYWFLRASRTWSALCQFS